MRGNSELIFVMCVTAALSARNCGDRMHYKNEKDKLRAEIDYQKQVEQDLLVQIQDLKDQIEESVLCQDLPVLEQENNVCLDTE